MRTSARLRNVGELHVVMDGEALEKSEDPKELLLGVVVQSDLKWSLQIKQTCRQVEDEADWSWKIEAIYE